MKRIISTKLVLLIAFSTILNPSYAKANKKPEIKPMTSEWEVPGDGGSGDGYCRYGQVVESNTYDRRDFMREYEARYGRDKWEELVEAVKCDRTWGYKASRRVI